MRGIQFIKGNGGLARTLPGKDHVSGLIFYNQLLPGFVDSVPYPFFSLRQVEQQGLTAAANGFVHRQVAEFFRLSPRAELWLMFTSSQPNDSGMARIVELQEAAGGQIRQVGIAAGPNAVSEFNALTGPELLSLVGELQQEAVALYAAYTPLVILLYAPTGTMGAATLPNLRTAGAAANYVSVVWARDGQDNPMLGTALGAVALASVHENIGWVEKFNLLGGPGTESPRLGDGTGAGGLAEAAKAALSDKGYVFAHKFSGQSGTYFYDSVNAASALSDFAFIENNRTVDKAVRGVYAALFPYINAPARVQADGKLATDLAAELSAKASGPLEAMRADGEVSGFEVFIDPAQNVVSNDKVVVVVRIQPVGVLRFIEVPIGFTLSF